MVIEMDTMKMFPVLGFVVNNHTKGLLGSISNIEQFAILGTTISKFSQTSNTVIRGSRLSSSETMKLNLWTDSQEEYTEYGPEGGNVVQTFFDG